MVTEVFEFISCETISINYQQTGFATVSFTVVSTFEIPGLNPVRDFTQLTFGGIDFKGFITQLNTAVIPASVPTVFEHRFTIMATGCATNCPRGV